MRKNEIIQEIDNAIKKCENLITVWDNRDVIFQCTNSFEDLKTLKRNIIYKYDENTSLYNGKYRLIGAFTKGNHSKVNKKNALLKIIRLAEVRNKSVVVIYHNKKFNVDKLITYERLEDLYILKASIEKNDKRLETSTSKIEAFFIDEGGEF